MRLIRHVGGDRVCLAEGASPAKLTPSQTPLTSTTSLAPHGSGLCVLWVIVKERARRVDRCGEGFLRGLVYFNERRSMGPRRS
jgi:hypothetical protein